MIPIGVLQRVMDAEVEKNVAIMARTGYDEPQTLKRQGIPLKENKTLNDALGQMAKTNETNTGSGSLYLSPAQYEISKQIRVLHAESGAHLANEVHSSEYQGCLDIHKTN